MTTAVICDTIVSEIRERDLSKQVKRFGQPNRKAVIMKETTRIFIQAIISDYNKACMREDNKRRLEYKNMLVGAITALKMEGIETPEIVYDDVLQYFSLIHIK